MAKWLKRGLHRTIVAYLRRCVGAFHTFPYGRDGRYVVLMTEGQYDKHQRSRLETRQ